MALLAAYDLALQYHGKPIFRGESVAIERGDRLGVVGPNGSGKSTLLRILAGWVKPEAGRVVRSRGLRVGYLPQELLAGGTSALLDSLLASAPRREEFEERLAAVQSEIAECPAGPRQLALSQQLADLTLQLGDLDKRFAPHHARRILAGLGFSAADFERPLAEFSGGWRMRAALAALLFQQPEVLLLDEPTNHLDMPSVNWLNRFLAGFPCAFALVCHDREILNRHVRRVLSFESEGVRAYRGDYDAYVRLRAQELETLENTARRDEQRRKELEAFIERFKAKATKARQAQSKARLIEKMRERQVDLPAPRRSISITFERPARSGDPALELLDAGHCYGSLRVLAHVNLTVRRGDRIAVVGLNGAGKTTLLKLVAGELPLREGTLRLGANVRPSYFAQHHADVLAPERTVLEEVWRAAPRLSQSQARGLCGAFLFSGDEVEKRIGVLSGGEKTRVALARLLAAPGNLLLLDEPTNHLDTGSAEKLTESLQTYRGTMLFVSHNLDFARRLSTKVWDVRDGTVVEYPGALADYLERWSDIQDRFAAAEAGASAPHQAPAEKEARIKDRQELLARRRERARLERRVAVLEAQVEELERETARLERELSQPAVYQDKARAAELARRFLAGKEELAQRLATWEGLSAELEALPEE